MRNAEWKSGSPSSLFSIPHSAFSIDSGVFMRKVAVAALLLLAACKTVGVSTTAGGYAEVSPQIANEMMLDSRQVVLLDIRPSALYRGTEGHIAGAISAPFETIE